MATSIQMNILKEDNLYEILYPQITTNQIVSGTLSVSRGGTGVTSYSSLATKLSSYIDSGATIRTGSYWGTGSGTLTFNLFTGAVMVGLGSWGTGTTSGTFGDDIKGPNRPQNFIALPVNSNVSNRKLIFSFISGYQGTNSTNMADITIINLTITFTVASNVLSITKETVSYIYWNSSSSSWTKDSSAGYYSESLLNHDNTNYQYFIV